MMKRILGLDYGSKTVGVAISDPLGLTAQSLETITRKEENKLRRTCARIEELIQLYQVECIVLGLPKHMDDQMSEMGEKVLAFAAILERRTGLNIVLWDERLTTYAANEILAEMAVPKEKRKQYVDKIAAAFILQGYMDSQKEHMRSEHGEDIL